MEDKLKMEPKKITIPLGSVVSNIHVKVQGGVAKPRPEKK